LLVEWHDIKAMLDVCAEGWTSSIKDHNRIIIWKKKTAKLPLGAHNDRGDRQSSAEIQPGHIRKLSRIFGIIECAYREIPKLKQ